MNVPTETCENCKFFNRLRCLDRHIGLCLARPVTRPVYTLVTHACDLRTKLGAPLFEPKQAA
jgi:hypothetical protein